MNEIFANLELTRKKYKKGLLGKYNKVIRESIPTKCSSSKLISISRLHKLKILDFKKKQIQ